VLSSIPEQKPKYLRNTLVGIFGKFWSRNQIFKEERLGIFEKFQSRDQNISGKVSGNLRKILRKSYWETSVNSRTESKIFRENVAGNLP
jgi:hypothetical protein